MGLRRDRSERSGGRGIRHRIRYRLDNVLARGTWAALAWLGIVTLAAVMVSGLLLSVFDVSFTSNEDDPWIEDVWQSLLRALDTGTMAGDVGWGRRILALLVTMFGLLVAGTLIGIIAAGVEDRVDRMRMGRSVVIESGHVVILGCSDRLPVVVEQLVLANRARGGGAVVVLAPGDPAEMQKDVLDQIADRRGTRIVFRSGDPTTRSGLALVGLAEARAVVVLARGTGDAAAVTTVMAVAAELGDLDAITVVVELRSPATAPSLERACGTSVHPLVPSVAVARMAAFAMREPGLYEVMEELFDFHRSDLVVADQPQLRGRSFGDVVRHFANARPVGLMDVAGGVELNPRRDRRLADDDRLVLLAGDLDTLRPSARSKDIAPPERPREPVDEAFAVASQDRDEHLLVIGWNTLGEELLSGWSASTGRGSTVEVVVDPSVVAAADVVVHGLDDERLTVTERARRDPVAPRDAVATAPTTVVLLGAVDLDTDEADSRTLLDYHALLRDLRSPDGSTPRFVLELMDSAHEELVIAGPDDVVVSQAIGSRFLAQLAEQPERRQVYLALYAATGPTIRHIPAERLGLSGDVGTSEVIDAADAAGLLAIGWRRTRERGGTITLNPDEAATVHLAVGDQILVIG